jgi:Peptidase C26
MGPSASCWSSGWVNNWDVPRLSGANGHASASWLPAAPCATVGGRCMAVKGRGELGRPVLESVLSMHHQAVEALAPGLEVSATAPDGVIETFEDSSPIRWWVATQFHPEWSTHLHWVMGLFSAFVDASRAYSAIPRGEIEPLRVEMRDWLRQCDRSSTPQAALSPLHAEVSNAPITPVTKRTSPLLHPSREAV